MRIYLIANANHESLYARLPWVCCWSGAIVVFFLLQIYFSKKFYAVVDADDLFHLNINNESSEDQTSEQEKEEYVATNEGSDDPDVSFRKNSNGQKKACLASQ